MEKQYVPAKELFSEVWEVLQLHYEAEFTVTGNSMWPLMRHGRDQVILEKCEETDLKKMDIVLFETEDSYLLHRITALKGDLMQTTGDKNCFRDGWFPKSSVVGRVAKLKRKGKILLLQKKRWRFLGFAWELLFPIRKWLLQLWIMLKK